MNKDEKETASLLLTGINKAQGEDKRLRAVNAYREFMAAIDCRCSTEIMVRDDQLNRNVKVTVG